MKKGQERDCPDDNRGDETDEPGVSGGYFSSIGLLSDCQSAGAVS